jgi:hypothetical protein
MEYSAVLAPKYASTNDKFGLLIDKAAVSFAGTAVFYCASESALALRAKGKKNYGFERIVKFNYRFNGS